MKLYTFLCLVSWIARKQMRVHQLMVLMCSNKLEDIQVALSQIFQMSCPKIQAREIPDHEKEPKSSSWFSCLLYWFAFDAHP